MYDNQLNAAITSCPALSPSPAYLDHVEAMEGRPELVDDGEALEWGRPDGDLPIHMRTIRRHMHRGRASTYILCGPGLLAALPERRLSRNTRDDGTTAQSRRWTDVELVDRWCGVMIHRGRGLTEHDQVVIAEMITRGLWGPRSTSVHLPGWMRSRLWRGRPSHIAVRILEYLTAARRKGRGWLVYTNAWLADVIDCDPRSIPRAIQWLEARAIVWRHATVRPGQDGADRPVDQDRNLLVPGPRWMREADAWARSTEDERPAIERAGHARHRRQRAARARARRIEITPATIEEFTSAATVAAAEQDEIVESIAWVEDVELREVATDHARAIVAGEMSPTEALERESEREAQRAELAARVDRLYGRYSREAIEKRRRDLSSNWDDRKSSQALPGLNPHTGRSQGPTSRPPTKPHPRRDRDTSPPASVIDLLGLREVCREMGVDSRPSRGGDWYDRRYARESDRPPELIHRDELGGGSPRQEPRSDAAILAWADAWSQSAAPDTPQNHPVSAKRDSQNNGVVMPRDPELAKLAQMLLQGAR